MISAFLFYSYRDILLNSFTKIIVLVFTSGSHNYLNFKRNFVHVFHDNNFSGFLICFFFFFRSGKNCACVRFEVEVSLVLKLFELFFGFVFRFCFSIFLCFY